MLDDDALLEGLELLLDGLELLLEPLAELGEDDDEEELLLDSSRPVISTSWLACWRSCALSPSRR